MAQSSPEFALQEQAREAALGWQAPQRLAAPLEAETTG